MGELGAPELLTVLIIWLLFCYLVGRFAKKRSLGFGLGFMLAFLLSPLIGLIIAALSSPIPEKIDRYKISIEEAKRALFKDDKQAAINHYLDALYYLENDYKNLKKIKDIESKNLLIENIEMKVKGLGGTVPPKFK